MSRLVGAPGALVAACERLDTSERAWGNLTFVSSEAKRVKVSSHVGQQSQADGLVSSCALTSQERKIVTSYYAGYTDAGFKRRHVTNIATELPPQKICIGRVRIASAA